MSNEIFYLQFNSPFEPAWATDQWVKIFSIFVWFSLRYSNFSIEKTDSPGHTVTDSPGHTVTIRLQKQNSANISGTTGLILIIFLVQNPYMLRIFLCTNISLTAKQTSVEGSLIFFYFSDVTYVYCTHAQNRVLL